MAFKVLNSLSLPGDPQKANEDAFAAGPDAAAVFDGATGLGENLLPGKSDAAWISQFGVRRLTAHLGDGDAPVAALRHALEDARKSFEGLRRRAPIERYEIPYASMMLAAARDGGFEALWFGDCAMLLLEPDGRCALIGEAMHKRAAEAARARQLAEAKGMPPVGALSRAEFLPHIRTGRNAVNTARGGWLFSPDPHAADHVEARRAAVPRGTLALLCSDGFLALCSDYGVCSPATLMERARDQGLDVLGRVLREVEDEDPDGRRFPRFKKCDDATAVLLEVV
jgi:hypothetical protein